MLSSRVIDPAGTEHGVLENAPDVSRPAILRLSRHVDVIDPDRAGTGTVRSRHQVEERALSGAVATDDRDKIALRHPQIGGAQSRDLVHRTGVKRLAHTVQSDHRSPFPTAEDAARRLRRSRADSLRSVR